jgi:hypothetical protein
LSRVRQTAARPRKERGATLLKRFTVLAVTARLP